MPVAVPAFDWARHRSPDWIQGIAQRPQALFFLQTLTLLLTFVVFQWLLEHAAVLPDEAYFEPNLAVALVVRLGFFFTAVALAGVVFLGRWGALFSPWQNLEQGSVLRLFTLVLAVALAWPFATMGYNHYLDQPQFLDRALLVLLLPLIWWRPVFLVPFLLLLYTDMGQLVEASLGGSILAHKLQVSRTLGIVAAAILVHGATGQRATAPLVFLIACFVAAQYWLPALAKLKLGWLSGYDFTYMPLAAYAKGWLNFLPSERVVEMTRAMAPFEPALRLFVIAMEAGALVLLWRRWLAVGLLLAAIAMHLGIYVFGGLFFWTWITLDLALLALLVGRHRWPQIYAPAPFLLSVVLIATSAWWARPPALGWLATPLSYTYRVDAIIDHGQRVPLHPKFFAPYEDVFTMTGFAYASNSHGVLTGNGGVTKDIELKRKLATATTPDEIYAMEGPATGYNEFKAQRLYDFIVRFVANRNANGDRLTWLYALHPPLQTHSQAPGLRVLGDTRVHAVIIVEVTTFYDGEKLQVIREIPLAQYDVPAVAGAARD